MLLSCHTYTFQFVIPDNHFEFKNPKKMVGVETQVHYQESQLYFNIKKKRLKVKLFSGKAILMGC